RDLARYLVAEIGHHRDAAAVAAERVMHPRLFPHMRKRIEGECGVAGPAMGDAHPAKLREPVGHVAVEDTGAEPRVDLRKTRATAEHHALAVWRHAVISQHPLGIAKGTALGDQACRQVPGELL